jgi:hypothetical protein
MTFPVHLLSDESELMFSIRRSLRASAEIWDFLRLQRGCSLPSSFLAQTTAGRPAYEAARLGYDQASRHIKLCARGPQGLAGRQVLDGGR